MKLKFPNNLNSIKMNRFSPDFIWGIDLTYL